MDKDQTSKPGDLLLNRYFSDADPETRERAREAFRRYAHHLVRIGECLLREEQQQVDSTEFDRRPTIHPTPMESLEA